MEDKVSVSVLDFKVLVSKMRRKSLSWFLIPILRCKYPRPRFGCNLPSHSPTLPSPL